MLSLPTGSAARAGAGLGGALPFGAAAHPPDGGCRTLLCVAFHRTMSSSVSRWLHLAGLTMGGYLMPPTRANPEGHYEDVTLARLHDRLLALNGTDWRFRNVSNFDPWFRQDLLERYVRRREAMASGPWGVKDPRICLFLPVWRHLLGQQGCYLVLLRHWAASLQSLFRRHSEMLALGEGNAELHVDFWRHPELAARMWLAYHRPVLALLEQERRQCLVVTQQALLAGLPLIDKVNEQFNLALDTVEASPIRRSLAHDRIEECVRDRLPPLLVEELEGLWRRLLSHADYRMADERPAWVCQQESFAKETQLLLQAVRSLSGQSQCPGVDPGGELQEQLRLLAENAWLPLDAGYWYGRIEREERFTAGPWELLARAQLARGDALGAEGSLLQALLCGKPRASLFRLLGACRQAELDDEGADHFYRQAIALDDADINSHLQLCRLWWALGGVEEAELHLRQVLERQPAKAALLTALAECLDQQGRGAEAMELLERQMLAAPQLVRQLGLLHMKRDPERIQALKAPWYRDAAARVQTQRRLLQALASIAHPPARQDLARRIVTVWQKVGVSLDPDVA